MIVFGPIPSRRLGRSLGINNIPPKHCSYSCTYCQIGRTTSLEINRHSFLQPETIRQAVEKRLAEFNGAVDYLSFVPDGEPTLDIHLGRTIELLRTFDLPVAIITNASLVWRPDVRADLMRADWVSLKVDTVDENIWRRLNCPSRHLNLSTLLVGMLDFAEMFRGTLVTETMLVENQNDQEESLRQIASFLGRLQPARSYLSIPTRPPAKPEVKAPDEASVNRAFQIVSERVEHVECLTGYEGNAFAANGDLENDLLSIAAVHPLRKDAVQNLCVHDHAGWERVEALVQDGQLAEVRYGGHIFYSRKWKTEKHGEHHEQ